MSAAAAVKIPLVVKKGLKDADPEIKKQLGLIETALGYPVTFNFNIESLYTATQGHSRQDEMGKVVSDYIYRLRECLVRETEDGLAKPYLTAVWTTKNITLTCESTSFDGDEYVKNVKNIAVWGGCCGLRFINGDLDIYTKNGNEYFNGTNQIGQIYLHRLLANAPCDLPLLIRKEMKETEDKQKAVAQRIAKSLGIDAVKIDWEGDAKAIVARGSKLRNPYKMEYSLSYLDSLAQCFEEQAQDEMIKEAVNEIFTTKIVSLKVYDSVEGVPGLELHWQCNGIQFIDGQVNVFTPPEEFGIVVVFVMNIKLSSCSKKRTEWQRRFDATTRGGHWPETD